MFAEEAAVDDDVLAGDVMITGVNDVASLTALRNSLVELNEVASANKGLLYGRAILKSALDNRAAGEVEAMDGARMQFRGAGNINAGEINNFDDSLVIGGTANHEADGDFNDDGIVDMADLGILGANWSASQATGNVSALVPESTTRSLLAMSVLMVGRRRAQWRGSRRSL